MRIDQIILEAAKKHGDHIAIQDQQGSLSYIDFANEVKRLSQSLTEWGIESGEGMGVIGRNSRQFIIAVFAALDAGCVVMPISNQLKEHEINKILQEAGLHRVLDDGAGPNMSQSITEEIELQGKPWSLRMVKEKTESYAAHVDEPAIIRFTSGTTGKSKGVIISHNSINERIDSANAFLQLGTEDTVVWVLQMSYHFVVSIILYLKYGCTIAICDEFLAHSILAYANEHNGTLLYASPMHIRLLANDKSEQQLSSMKHVISTSTAITAPQCEAFKNRYNIPVSQAYGIIEIGLPIINYDKAEEHPDAVGYALDAYDVEILTDEFEIISDGSIGHLAIRGPGMFDAYLTPPAVRSDILEEGWFMTGDLASKDKSGLIKIEGREKSMINVSGNKVFPEEVEAVLNMHPDIEQCRVRGFKHRFMGEMVEADIVLKAGKEIDSEEVIGFCRERLSTYKVPQKLHVVEALQMTDSGKIQRH